MAYIRETYTISEAFKALNEKQTYVIRNGEKVKKNYKGGFEGRGLGFEDLFDQVYCTLTHGGDLGADRRILGDLGRTEIKYNDDHVSIDYSDPKFPRICIVDTEERLQNAKIIAQIYNLEYEVRPFGRGLSKIYISVPADEPVDHTVFHYIDANDELVDIVNNTEDDKVPVLASAESDSNKTSIAEDVQTSMPVTPLTSAEIHDFVENIPVATGNRPPQPFKLGYIREMRAEIPAKYKGGRGSEGQPFVRIFKASEYSKLYTKAAYESLGSTKAYRKETGKEAGGERTGFHSTAADEGNILNAIGSYPNGDLALQAYPMSDNKIKVKYFISLDDSDLVPATKEEVANYLTPAAASKLLGTRDSESDVPRTADNINRFKLSGIYMIGNLGHSIIR